VPDGTCLIEGCDRPVGRVKSRGWCTAHYTRWQRHGSPVGGRERYGTSGCDVLGCDRPHHARGLCRPHAIKVWRDELPSCSEPDCDRPQRNRGWCSAHYQRWRAHGHPQAGPAFRRPRGTGFPSEWYSEQRRRKIGFPTAETLEYVAILRGDPCSYCGAPWEHTDHIQPVVRGGAGDWTNLTAACARCNHAKHVKPLLTFLLDRLEG
jgi:hypothetical protein